MPTINRIGVIANEDKPACLVAARSAIEHLRSRGAQALIAPATAEALSLADEAGSFASADCLLVIGGDGTILRSAQTALRYDLPILGVNFGRIGFLSEVEPDALIPALDCLLQGKCREESRLLLEAEFGDQRCLALNDVLLCKLHHSRTVVIEARVDGKSAALCSCDGILVSTPTGSTAYALSAGGPIVAPELDAIQVTPICPHTISARPMMLSAASVVEMRLVQDHANSAQLCADGELLAENFACEKTLTVRAARERLRFLRLGESNYFALLRQKLFNA